MNAIKSLDDLKKVREDALAKRKISENSGSTQVIVGMGTCGIAAGARETMKSVLDYIEATNVENVVVSQTGCIGLCEQDPILQVVLSGKEKVTYGKVNPDVAKKIMKEHVGSGTVVQDHVITL